MKQVVITAIRPIGVQGLGAFPAILIQIQVHKAFVLEHMKQQFIDRIFSFGGFHGKTTSFLFIVNII